MTDDREQGGAHDDLEQFAAVVEGSDDAIVGTNLEGVIKSWNTAAERLFGYRPEEIIGEPIEVLSEKDRTDQMTAALVAISPEGFIDANQATVEATGLSRDELIGTSFSEYFTEPDKADEIYQFVLRDAMADEYPLKMRHRNGTLTEVRYNAAVYRDAEGRVLGVFAAARAVTKQMEAQAETADQKGEVLERQAELERLQQFTVGREVKMYELKRENESLRKRVVSDDDDAGDGH